MATVIDVTGAKYPKAYNGHDLLPVESISRKPAFDGKPLNRPKPIFWEHEGNRAARQGKWMAVSKFLEPWEPWELYDIATDRTKQHNLAKHNPDALGRMSAQWESWSKVSFVDQWQGRHRNDWGEEEREAPGSTGSKEMVFDLRSGANLARYWGGHVAATQKAPQHDKRCRSTGSRSAKTWKDSSEIRIGRTLSMVMSRGCISN